MPDATFARPDLTTFARLDELGLEVVGQRLEPDGAVLACRVVEADQWCRRCGCQGSPRDTVIRRLAHVPLGWRPTTLLVTAAATGAAGVGTCGARTPRTRPSRGRSCRVAGCGGRWPGIVCQHLSVARVAEGLAVAWHTAADAVLAEGRRVLIDDPARFDGVAVIGVDWGYLPLAGAHVWRHATRRHVRHRHHRPHPDPLRQWTGLAAGHGPGPLQAGVQGLARRASAGLAPDGVEVVAMVLRKPEVPLGFTGFTTATTEELPDAVTVMDPVHVVRLAGDALDRCRRRVQQELHGHRGRTGDPLYRARRTLHTGTDLLTDEQQSRLTALFAADAHVQVEATWGIYQRMVAAYREPDRARGREQMQRVIEAVSRAVPAALPGIITSGGPSSSAPPTSWPTSTAPAPATDRPKPSTAAWSTCAAPPSASATSPTTSPDA